MNITDESIESAIKYLTSTDESHAKARANLSALQELRKTMWAFCRPDKGTQDDKDAAARTHVDYTEHIEKIKAAEIEFHTLHNKRKRAELMVELYRTQSANQRRGNI
jgi:hypothetical protein